MSQLGSRYYGSSAILTSSGGDELVPDRVKFYKFSFMNHNVECTVSINNSDPIYLSPNQGFSANEVDAVIHSFVIIDSGVDYNWIAGA